MLRATFLLDRYVRDSICNLSDFPNSSINILLFVSLLCFNLGGSQQSKRLTHCEPKCHGPAIGFPRASICTQRQKSFIDQNNSPQRVLSNDYIAKFALWNFKKCSGRILANAKLPHSEIHVVDFIMFDNKESL